MRRAGGTKMTLHFQSKAAACFSLISSCTARCEQGAESATVLTHDDNEQSNRAVLLKVHNLYFALLYFVHLFLTLLCNGT